MLNDPHIARVFDRDLEAVQAMIMKMGGLVEAALSDAAKALDTQDECSGRTSAPRRHGH